MWIGIVVMAGGLAQGHGQAVRYDIGEPTPEEQFFVELVNRARANPTAEGQRLATVDDVLLQNTFVSFGVDLNMMKAEFAALAAGTPLSISKALTSAARLHTADMYAHGFQGHTGSDGRTAQQRATDAGYSGSVAENVFASIVSPLYGHVGFEVNWGSFDSVGGMQRGRGHRTNIHNTNFREIGIGVLDGLTINGPTQVGPKAVTQKLAVASTLKQFVTGVAHFDLNGNLFYDMGEGVGGVTVTVAGVNHFAITSGSGGYSVPVPGNGSYTVTFSMPGRAPWSTVATVANGENVKVDFRPQFIAPAIAGNTIRRAEREEPFTFTSAPAPRTDTLHIGYINSAPGNITTATVSEVIFKTTPGYNVVQTAIKPNNSPSAYRLAHFDRPLLQEMEINRDFLAGSSSAISFRSRCVFAGKGQVAKLQVHDGTTWKTVWSQAGDRFDDNFVLHTVSLSAFSGKSIRVRFVYDWVGGSDFYNANNPSFPSIGWFLNSVSFSGLPQYISQVAQAVDVPGTQSIIFPAAANYAFRIVPEGSFNLLPAGPVTNVSVIENDFTGWKQVNGLEAGTSGLSSLSTSSTQTSDENDLNGNGRHDLLDYAFEDQEAITGSDSAAPYFYVEPATGQSRMAIDYYVDSTKDDLSMIAEVSSNLGVWYTPSAPGPFNEIRNERIEQVSQNVEKRRVSVASGNASSLFLRLRSSLGSD